MAHWLILYHPIYFWIVTVQDWFRTSPANAVHPLRTLIFSSVTDIDILLDKNEK